MNPKAISSAPVETIPIASITIGQRRRRKFGAIAKLAADIEANGLLHPIGVDADGLLVFGGRRLAAAKSIGRVTIQARRFGRLTDEEREAIELAENVQRLDLDDYESSRERLAEIRAEREAARAEVSSRAGTKPSPRGGRPKEPGSRRDVAARTGYSPTEQKRIERHVEAGERYPALRQLPKGAAIDAADKLDAMPEPVAEAVNAMIESASLPPQKAIKVIENVAAMPKPEQREVAKLARSDDPDDQRLAATRATRNPPVPPARLTWIREAIKNTERALDDKISAGKGELRSALASLKAALKESEQHYGELRRKEGF